MAVRHETVEAVVLRHEDRGEADRCYALFSRWGRIWARARGARRSRSRLAGALENWNVVQVTLYGNGPTYTVTGVHALATFPRLKSRLEDLAAAGVLMELVERWNPEGDLLPWLTQSLAALDAGAPALPWLLRSVRELLVRSGWDPGGRLCPACGQPLAGKARVPARAEVLVHPACGSGGVVVSAPARAWLAGEGELPKGWGEVWEVLMHLVEFHLEAELRSLAFARTVLWHAPHEGEGGGSGP